MAPETKEFITAAKDVVLMLHEMNMLKNGTKAMRLNNAIVAFEVFVTKGGL